MDIKTEAASLIKNLTSPEPSTMATSDSPPWINQVAMLTGALAALAGFLTVRSTVLTNEAIYESNQAILSQTQASDDWSEYQAESIKAHMVEVQMLGVPTSPNQTQLQAMDKDLRDRQPGIKKDANDKITERDDHLAYAKHMLSEKDILGYASMAAQLGIALASVAALIRKRSVFYIGALCGLAGVILTAYVFLGDYLG